MFRYTEFFGRAVCSLVAAFNCFCASSACNSQTLQCTRATGLKLEAIDLEKELQDQRYLSDMNDAQIVVERLKLYKRAAMILINESETEKWSKKNWTDAKYELGKDVDKLKKKLEALRSLLTVRQGMNSVDVELVRHDSANRIVSRHEVRLKIKGCVYDDACDGIESQFFASEDAKVYNENCFGIKGVKSKFLDKSVESIRYTDYFLDLEKRGIEAFYINNICYMSELINSLRVENSTLCKKCCCEKCCAELMEDCVELLLEQYDLNERINELENFPSEKKWHTLFVESSSGKLVRIPAFVDEKRKVWGNDGSRCGPESESADPHGC